MRVRSKVAPSLTRRVALRAATGLVVVPAVLALASGPAGAATNTVTIPVQGGNHTFTAHPGDLAVAGYDFTFVAGATTVIANASAQLSVSCVDGSTPTHGTVTISFPNATYVDNSTNSDGWVPSGQQGEHSVYQGSLALPDLCHGGTMTIGEHMGPFVADVYSDNTAHALHFRWHYGSSSVIGAGGTSWSATKSVDPAPLSGVPAAPLFGGWAPLAVAGAFVVGVSTLIVRRQRASVRIG